MLDLPEELDITPYRFRGEWKACASPAYSHPAAPWRLCLTPAAYAKRMAEIGYPNSGL